jgi:hypothetical protein
VSAEAFGAGLAGLLNRQNQPLAAIMEPKFTPIGQNFIPVKYHNR